MAFPNASSGTAKIDSISVSGPTTSLQQTTAVANADGFDLIYFQTALQQQMGTVQSSIDSIQNNANLSDTEKMFSMQMAMNTWSAIANLRTNMLKSVSDTLKTITRNVN